MNTFLITGAMRSGTTLLQKLLCAHPRLTVYPQPLPLLYVAAKREYLQQTQGKDPHYPIADQFQSTYSPPADFTNFLLNYRLDPSALTRIVRDMTGYSGRQTRLSHGALPMPGSSMSVAAYVERTLASLADEEGLTDQRLGSKEVFCEEYIPYLLGQGFRIILVVRDPRDVLASATAGSGGPSVGRRRPALFVLRQWRKSIAYALEHAKQPNLICCRFEDLVRRPQSTLNPIFSFLGVESQPGDREDRIVKDRSGSPWTSNSSLRPSRSIDLSAVGRYREVLSPQWIRWTEALVLPEMLSFSYRPMLSPDEVTSTLEQGPPEAEILDREELLDYRWSEHRQAEEQDRWRRIQSNDFDPATFLFPRAFQQLRGQLVAPADES